jgi:hypothetical protein
MFAGSFVVVSLTSTKSLVGINVSSSRKTKTVRLIIIIHGAVAVESTETSHFTLYPWYIPHKGNDVLSYAIEVMGIQSENSIIIQCCPVDN